jgi:hypothetical protein
MEDPVEEVPETVEEPSKLIEEVKENRTKTYADFTQEDFKRHLEETRGQGKDMTPTQLPMNWLSRMPVFEIHSKSQLNAQGEPLVEIFDLQREIEEESKKDA